MARRLNPDRQYISVNGSKLTLPGRALMFVRNVGHLMTNEAILDSDGNEVPEGILDGILTTLIAIHDLKRTEDKNSRAGSVYIVKPKMHGPEEVSFANHRPCMHRRVHLVTCSIENSSIDKDHSF